ncbi:hypothetical protein [Parabacteroides goldsteinii]|uniref:hypothetical protein n=1 Tax=Parabacteroides goldsteinii TaxID=328812 RepID=UPI00241F4FAA|nr:hypothetical protein [Parabacteroides goldsteinii]
MTKDFNRFYLSKRMFLGATMLLTSVGLASANPGIEIPVSDALVASPQQAKKKVTGTVEDALGPIAGANVVERAQLTERSPIWTVNSIWKFLLMLFWL